MCGIVSLCYEDEEAGMGIEAAALLKRLEYRGYDSTGASFIDASRKIALVKSIGAPSRVCRDLGIDKFPGQRFIGQVRWATYGAVTDANSQPHHVRCKVEMVGAHNGNISNTDTLKAELSFQGHRIVSENDGEIVVHLVEDAWDENRKNPGPVLESQKRALTACGLSDIPDEVLLMVDAVRRAESRTQGSYAAAVADPTVPGVFAIKSGSSLYAGIGTDKRGSFVVVSSDLTSVLSKTRTLIPLAEGEGLWFTHDRYLVFSLSGEARYSRPRPKRSKLNVQDTALDPRYSYYMEQEISCSPANIEEILRYYFRDPQTAGLEAGLEDKRQIAKESLDRLLALTEELDESALRSGAEAVFSDPAWRELAARVKEHAPRPEAGYKSDERTFLAELAKLLTGRLEDLALADAVLVWRKRRAVVRRIGDLSQAVRETVKAGGRVYLIASGTSYHAALIAAYFFDHLAELPVYPCNPGMFRSLYLDTLENRDLILGITQSGETKDLVDILQDARQKTPSLRRVSLVNNENSRIPQELSDFYLPLLCGPEIAVAATKSFLNQIVILYLLAAGFRLPEAEVRRRVSRIRGLLEETLRLTLPGVEAAANRLFREPSMHILGTGLIGLAREGALKIREVVLNHSEGYDAAEFKHGPNTILGKNTVFGLESLEAVLSAYATVLREASDTEKDALLAADPAGVLAKNPGILEAGFGNYPLVFVCPPDERDIRITISQIHTHKIRGADILLVAEKRSELALAVDGKPANDPHYRSLYLEIPSTGDRDLFVFSATLVLQWLAFRMSVLKGAYLDGLGVRDHGVHPDVPKNVSKSITVD